MKKWIIPVLLVALLCGCAAPSQDFTAAADQAAQVLLRLDEDALQLEACLDAVEGCLEGQVSLEAAGQTLMQSHAYFTEALAGTQEQTVSDDLAAQLQKLGISAQEFQSYLNARPAELTDQLQKVELLMYYLEAAQESPWDRETLVFYCAQYRRLQTVLANYYFYEGLNYWFPTPSRQEMDYLTQTIIHKLRCYRPEEVIWFSTERAIDDHVEGYFQEMETVITELNQHIAQEQERLYLFQRIYEELDRLSQTLPGEELAALLERVEQARQQMDQEALENLARELEKR